MMAAGRAPRTFLLVLLCALAAAAAGARPLRIAFIPKFKNVGQTDALSAYWQRAWEGAQRAAADLGVDVTLVTADVESQADADYVEPQIRLVAGLIASRTVDGLLIAPFDSNRLAPVVDKAIGAGIPSVAVDTPVNSDRVLANVVFDNYAAGKLVGAWVARRLGGRGKVLVLDGPADQVNAADRRRGFLAGLQSGDIDVLATRSGDWEEEPARRITAAWLEKFPRVDAIIAANDTMALGAAQAAREAKRPGIVITGFDASMDGLLAIARGTIEATVDQAPGDEAGLALRLLVGALRTGARMPVTASPRGIELVTRENIGEHLPRVVITRGDPQQ